MIGCRHENDGSYQVAGVAYLTGAVNQNVSVTRTVAFPYITNRLIVRRLDASGSAVAAAADLTKTIEISFTHPDQGNTDEGLHTWHLHTVGQELDMRVKCKELYVTTNSGARGSWQLYAELTNIPVDRMYALTGSGLTE